MFFEGINRIMKSFQNILSSIVLLALLLVGPYAISQSKAELIDFHSSECEGVYYENIRRLQNRIVEIDKTEEYHLYKIFVVTHCGGTEQGRVILKNDTLNLSYIGTIKKEIVVVERVNDSIEIVREEWAETIADCDCAFSLSYSIKGMEDKDYVVLANGKRIYQTQHKYKITRRKPSFDVVGNDTINYVDIYGLKQGLHVYNKKDGKPHGRIVYKDNQKISGLAATYYDFDGYEKVETFMEHGEYTIRKYYNNGKLIKTCDTDGTFDEGTNCTYDKQE